MSKNKKAIVTGGSRGIGRAIAEYLAKNYCSDVLISDIAFGTEDLDEAAKNIEDSLGLPNTHFHCFKADATSFDDAQVTVDEAVAKMGGVDILVNNAGITKDNLLLRMSEQDFDDVIRVNLKSVFNYTKAILRPMIKQRSGRIINIASVVGLIGNPGQANYVASKAGVIGFTKTMARELAPRNITVNAIAPGFIETAMTDKLSEEQKEGLLKQVPLGRMGQPEDIAKVVGFLSSEQAEYVTGQVIAVDGGMTM